MTALTEYQRLECTGVWRAGPDEQRRDVIVSIGDATLMISDSADRKLAHWSLPAIDRLNPGERPAIFAPGAEAPEELELSDDTMIAAIERVRQVIRKRRPQPGRLRLILLVGALCTVAALALFWLPDAMIRHTATVVPAAKRMDLGERLLGDIQRVAGRPCETLNGRRALDRLKTRLLPDSPARLIVLRDGISNSEHLPGGLILLHRSLVEDYEDPAVVAGFILAESLRATIYDPMEQLLDTTGVFSAFQLLTTGDVSDATLKSYAENLLTQPQRQLADEALLDRFESAQVRSTPYAFARDVTGESVLTLIEADPVPQGSGEPLLTDGQWVSLQGICGE